MLEPQTRQLLLDALRPPPGAELDRAIGTTYSLDLLSLLAAPLGFALLDREAADGRLVADPVALLEAVRRNADRIDVFCQASKIGIPRQHRPIFNYLEDSVHEVFPPNNEAIFHPKVWVIRYRRTDGQMTYRLLCLSRNLTFDRSWDTVLCLDGDPGPRARVDPRLPKFIERLPTLVFREMAEGRASAIHELAKELGSIVFTPPEGFDRIAFWPLGLEPNIWPFRELSQRLLIISPFLTGGCLARLGRKGAQDVVISRPEAFEFVGAGALAGVQETLVLSPSAADMNDPESLDSSGGTSMPPIDEVTAEGPSSELSGLHAKLYVADMPGRARVWTGSANATDAAFNGNVEFLVEMEGPKVSCGIDAVLGEPNGDVGLRKFLEPYSPASELPRDLTAAEQLDRRLDKVGRALTRLAFLATVEPLEGDTYSFRLEIGSVDGQAESYEQIVGEIDARVRPLTLGSALFQEPVPSGRGAGADFGTVSFVVLTSFFVVQLNGEQGGIRSTAEFVVNADLIGAPEDRKERTLVALLSSRRDLLRLLALLLGVLDADDLAAAVDLVTGDRSPQKSTWLLTRWQAVFEPMVRALATEPQRLDQVYSLIKELESTEEGRQLLPPAWREVWEPIWEARQALKVP